MRPTLVYIFSLSPVYDKDEIQLAWTIRSTRQPRYAKQRRISQQQRRRAVRRACPHGWTR